MAGLLGLGGFGSIGGAKPPAGLLGQYFDPAEMRRQQMKQGLLQAGIGMLQNGKGSFGEVLGNSLAGGLQGANNAGINYKNDAMGYQQLEQQMNEQKRKDAEYQEKEKQKAAIMQMISEDTPENQQLAHTNPQMYAEMRMKQQFAGQNGDGSEYGLVPQWGYNKKTKKYGLFQPNKGGGMPAQMQFPEGYEPQPPTSFQDLGTGVGAFSSRGGQPLAAPVPKDLRGAEIEKEIGTGMGKQIVAAPSDVAAADIALNLIDQIATDPNLDWGVGITSLGNMIPGTPGRDFQSRVDQAKSGAFLSAIQQLRGMGSLSNAEGDTATKAVTRLNTATSKEEFLSALRDYKDIVRVGRERAAARIPGGVGSPEKPEETYDADGNRIQ